MSRQDAISLCILCVAVASAVVVPLTAHDPAAPKSEQGPPVGETSPVSNDPPAVTTTAPLDAA